jgi:N-acetyl-gamma-glutamyl-phosphate reductase
MISTIYCDLDTNIKKDQVIECLNNFFSNKYFVKILKNEDKADLYAIQSTNYCLIKMFDHYDETKIILVSVIDNLLKGASGQAVQCMNIMCGIEENIGLDNLNCE